MEDKTADLLIALDELDRAVSAILVAQPFQMTLAATRLDAARKDLRKAVYGAYLLRAGA